MSEEDIARIYAARGYLVFATVRDIKLGEIRDVGVSTFNPLEGHIGQPFRIVSETDEADMDEQLRIGGVPRSRWGSPAEGERYYRIESD
jgi:hypothetical protein